MKKTIIIFVSAVFLQLVNVSAQQFGISSGYSLDISPSKSKELIRFNDFEVYKFAFVDSKLHPAFGVYLYDENEIIWTQMSCDFYKEQRLYTLEQSSYFLRDKVLHEIETERHLVSVGVSGGIKVGKIRIGGGPLLRIGLTQNSRIIEDLPDGFEFSDNSDKVFGFQFILGYQLHKRVQVRVTGLSLFEDLGDQVHFEGSGVQLGDNFKQAGISFNCLL